MNGTAKLYTICRVLGDFIMPPLFVFSFLKHGARGLQALARTAGPKIARVRSRFAEANEVRVVASTARRTTPPPATRITVDQSRPRPRPAPRPTPAQRQRQAQVTATREAHPPRPQPAAPLAKPIEEHTADDLIELARSEQAETAALNNAEAARTAINQVDEAVPAPAAASSADEVVDELMDTDEYKAVLSGLAGPEKTEAANAIEALSKSGASPGIVVGLFQKYAPHFRAEVARTPAGSENLWSKLGRYVKKEKAAGKSDEVIQRQIDEAFKCN